MILQKSSAFRPFARQLIMLAQIALRASYNDIIRRIAAAARKRDNVIDVIFPPDLAMAVIAFAFLNCILLVNIRARQPAVCMAFNRALMLTLCACLVGVVLRPFSRTSAGLLSMFCCVLSIISTLFLKMGEPVCAITPLLIFDVARAPSPTLFTVTLAMFGILPPLSLAHMLRMLMYPLLSIAAAFFLMRVVITTCLCCYTTFAPAFQTRFSRLTWAKEFASRRVIKTAFRAAFEETRQVQHSVSLSLSRWIMSASGASDRLSGISLADMFIIPQNGAES